VSIAVKCAKGKIGQVLKHLSNFIQGGRPVKARVMRELGYKNGEQR
jgi:hypothetical protein